MRKVDPKVYTKEFYLHKCLGSEEFARTEGEKLHWRVKKMLDQIKIKKSDVILDLGCGRGDISFFLSKRSRKVVGVDYSEDAIKLAKGLVRKKVKLQNNLEFFKMDATKLDFKKNSFDKVIAIDIFEHLYPEELEIAMKEIKKVLKPNGILFVHAGTNKYLHDYTYKLYIRPMNILLTKLDLIIRGKNYPSLPKNPRTNEELQQHVNEPSYFYLKELLQKFKFKGEIIGEVGYLKEKKSISSNLYNFLVALYPLSKLKPLNILFAWVFIVQAKNIK